MKAIILLALALFVASCSDNKKETEQYDPFPGGKSTEKKVK
jgi:hypothetical protein